MTERARLERVVEQVAKYYLGHDVPAVRVVDLLRRELAKRDARVRMIVKALKLRNEQSDACMEEDEIKQYSQALNDLLAALRGKGTR